jgi:4a-hydroxytetrahydrobiopterin dehydratase
MKAEKLSSSAVTAALAGMPGWQFKNDAVSATLKCPSFPDAVGLFNRLAFSAEAADHHPDVLISYRKVTVTWSTHDSGGVTQKDLDGVKETERLARQFGASHAA